MQLNALPGPQSAYNQEHCPSTVVEPDSGHPDRRVNGGGRRKTDEDVPQALRRGLVVVIGALSGVAGALVAAMAGWLVGTLTR